MSDGQTELGESIQQQSLATCCRVDVSQEAYTWQDNDGGWHVGHKLWNVYFLGATVSSEWIMYDNSGQHWRVCESRLKLYGPRCEACGGEGKQLFWSVDKPVRDCPACGGTGRSGNTIATACTVEQGLAATERLPCQECGGEGKTREYTREVDSDGKPCSWIEEDCPACGGSGRQ